MSTPQDPLSSRTHEEHPFEEVFKILIGRQPSEDEWTERAKNDYFWKDPKGKRVWQMLAGTVFFTALNLICLSLFLHPNSHITRYQALFATAICLLIARTCATRFIRLFWTGRQRGSPDQRWLPDGFGTESLEALLNAKTDLLWMRLAKQLDQNADEWRTFLARSNARPSLFDLATDFISVLRERNQKVRLTDSIRWLQQDDDPRHPGPMSQERLARLAQKLKTLTSLLIELERNPAFFNLSPDLCAETPLSPDHANTRKRLRELTELFFSIQVALYEVTSFF